MAVPQYEEYSGLRDHGLETGEPLRRSVGIR